MTENNNEEYLDDEVDEQPDDASSEVEETEEEENQESTVEKFQRLSQVAQKVGHALTSFVKFLAGVLGNPVSWVIMLMVLVGIGIYSNVQVIGSNENACFTNDDSGSSTAMDGASGNLTPEQRKQNANALGTWLMKTKFKGLDNKPFTKEQMAGVIGALYGESNFDPASYELGMPPINRPFNAKSSNADMAAIPVKTKQGYGVGLFAYSFGLRVELAKYADSKHKGWQDFKTQLEFTEKWLNDEIKGYPTASSVKQFANVSEKTPGGYAQAWNRYVERSASWKAGPNDPQVKKRRDFAEKFMKEFKPTESLPSSVGDSSGDAAACGDAGGGNFDNSGIVKMAISIAWPRDQRANSMVSGMSDGGRSKATPGFQAAKDKIQKETTKDPMDLWADCGRFAATVIKNTVDKDFPWGPTSEQFNYMEKHPDKYQKILKKSALHPGDILIVGGSGGSGHIAIYLGQYQGIDSIADASMAQRTGLIGDAGWYNEDLVSGDGRHFVGFRYSGPNGKGDDVASSAETSSAPAPAKSSAKPKPKK